MKKVLLVLVMLSFTCVCFAQNLQQQRLPAINLDKAEEQIVKKDENNITINKVVYDKTGTPFVVATASINRFELNKALQNIDEQLAILKDKDKLALLIADLGAQKAKIESMLDLIKAEEVISSP